MTSKYDPRTLPVCCLLSGVAIGPLSLAGLFCSLIGVDRLHWTFWATGLTMAIGLVLMSLSVLQATIVQGLEHHVRIELIWHCEQDDASARLKVCEPFV